MKKITFTGHRDRVIDPVHLETIALLTETGDVWVHGGATGFDTQVEAYAKEHNIPTQVIRPDYTAPGVNYKSAPIIRNKEMVKMADVVVALWDGRKEGGTYFTIEHARKLGKKIVTFAPVPRK